MSLNLKVAIKKEGDMYVAYALENNVASQGHTEIEAISNLREALELYYEDVEELPVYPDVKVEQLSISI
jgi:predicted RNase H-like HicB family nuclease